jgi:hypothetical protein
VRIPLGALAVALRVVWSARERRAGSRGALGKLSVTLSAYIAVNVRSNSRGQLNALAGRLEVDAKGLFLLRHVVWVGEGKVGSGVLACPPLARIRRGKDVA